MSGVRVSFLWSTRREGNSGYVLEECTALNHRIEYGPMPTHIVMAFVEARRRIVAVSAIENGGEPVRGPRANGIAAA